MYYLKAFYQRIVELWCHAKNFPNAPRISQLLLTAPKGLNYIEFINRSILNMGFINRERW